MGLESTSWSWLGAGIRKTVPHFSLCERIENGLSAGTADVSYCIRGVEGWIELKAVDLPARDGTAVLGRKELNKEQINWHLMRAQVRSVTWVFITAAPYRWLVAGMFAREINDWTRDELCMRSRFWYDENWKEQQWLRFVEIIAPRSML